MSCDMLKSISKTFLVSCHSKKDETQYVLYTLVILYTLIVKENPWLQLIILKLTILELFHCLRSRALINCEEELEGMFPLLFLFQSTPTTILVILKYPFNPPPSQQISMNAIIKQTMHLIFLRYFRKFYTQIVCVFW